MNLRQGRDLAGGEAVKLKSPSSIGVRRDKVDSLFGYSESLPQRRFQATLVSSPPPTGTLQTLVCPGVLAK